MSNSIISSRIALTFAALAGIAAAQGPVLNEVYYDAPSADDGQVFVEVYGPSGFDLSGWRIQSINGSGLTCLQSFTFPAGTLIPSDGCVVVADATASGVTQVANADFLVTDFDLQNGPEGLQLIDAVGNLADAMAYGPVPLTGTSCNGLAWFEGTPARDVFAPLSVERVPAGTDTDNNDADFTPNNPTPGVAAACTTALERVGPSAVSGAAGPALFLDFWLEPCGANRPYVILIALTDPALVAPPLGLPVYDSSTPIWLEAVLAGGPFVSFVGTLDAQGHSVGQARLDFSAFPVVIGGSFDIWLGATVYDQAPFFRSTNALQVTINP
ncbi:MAG: lamin tail domain-containing protein [Planctomycetes bacterium]|nr:lamin tail domain-containing protein [Planctomycetota bacterium]